MTWWDELFKEDDEHALDSSLIILCIGSISAYIIGFIACLFYYGIESISFGFAWEILDYGFFDIMALIYGSSLFLRLVRINKKRDYLYFLLLITAWFCMYVNVGDTAEFIAKVLEIQ